MKNTESIACRMVVAGVDVTGFAQVCEGRPDIEIFDTLHEYYECVGKVVSGAGGRIVKFIGDAVLIVFPEQQAVLAASILTDLKQVVQPIWSRVDDGCRVRMKAHIGTVVCGPIGPDTTFDVIGKVVNELFQMPWEGPDLSADLEKAIGR